MKNHRGSVEIRTAPVEEQTQPAIPSRFNGPGAVGARESSRTTAADREDRDELAERPDRRSRAASINHLQAIPPPLAGMFAGLEPHAQAAPKTVRNIARGIYPTLLVDFGVREALRVQAARAAIHVSFVRTVPRSTEEAEQAVYFARSEAIQNAARHAGRTAQVTLWLDQHDRTLAVRIAHDGLGFDPTRTPAGAGLQNIRDSIQDHGGVFRTESKPGHGTVLTISLPWTSNADRAQ